MGNTVAEDMRQSYVIMKNEIKKFFSGKRMLLFLGLLGAILFVLTIMPYVVGKHLPSDPKQILVTYLSMSSLIVLMAATLFASISIVSEYEERTALIVFTRPIKKSSIFIGKLLACLIVSIGFIALYYIIVALVSLIVAHGVETDLFLSMLMAFVYAFATTGIAMLVSSFMKKSNTSTILTFVILLVIIGALSLVLGAAGMDTSWMIDKASESITNCSEGYRDTTNELLNSLQNTLSDPKMFLRPGYETGLPAMLAPYSLNEIVAAIGAYWGMSAGFLNGAMLTAPDLVHDTIVMFAWGFMSLVGAFILFLRREF